MCKVKVSRMRMRYAQTVLTFRITYVLWRLAENNVHSPYVQYSFHYKNLHEIHDFLTTLFCLFVFNATAPQGTRASSSFTRFLDHTQRLTTAGRTLLGEWSARRRDLYLTTHNTHNRQTSMPPVGFEPTIPVGERLQIYALDRVATETGLLKVRLFHLHVVAML